MADAQIAIIDGDQTQVVVVPGENPAVVLTAGEVPAVVSSIPGPQGPAGAVGVAIDGSAAFPSISFASDPDTGLYRVAANQLGVSTGGTQRLVIDSSGQIEATSLGTAASPTWSFVGDPNTGIYSPGADQLALATGGTGRLFVDASGNVLINDSASVTSNVSAYLRIRQQNAASDTSIGIINAQNSDANATVKIKAGQATRNGGEIVFGRENGTDWSTVTVADGYIAFSPVLDNANTERLRITSAGFVGIGTSAPVHLLHLASSSASNQQLSRTGLADGNGSDVASIQFANGTGAVSEIRAGGDGDTQFNTRALSTDSYATRLFIKGSTGNVGIGTTSPTQDLDLRNSGSAAVFQIVSGVASTTSTSTVQLVAFSSASAVAGTARINGTAPAGGQSELSFLTSPSGNAPVERARIDSSGRLLVGHSTSLDLNAPIQAASTGFGVQAFRFSTAATGTGGAIDLARSNSGTVGTTAAINSGQGLGIVRFRGAGDSSTYITGAQIEATSDGGTVSATSMPTCLVFSVCSDGASSPTECFRITNDGVIAHDQPAPAAVNATATLTIANLKAGIITSTSVLATDMTLPTGTDTQAGFSGTYNNFTFEWSVINTGPSLVRVLAGTAHTVVGSGSVATGTSGRFASRRTAANTFVSYRLS